MKDPIADTVGELTGWMLLTVDNETEPEFTNNVIVRSVMRLPNRGHYEFF
jgi:hypothetical protein